MNYEEVYQFWFQEIDSKKWFQKDPHFDLLIKERFLGLHEAAAKNELFTWRSTPQGALCEVIILDQFSRNIFRDSPLAFQYDPLSLCLSQWAIEKEFDKKLNSQEKSFLYMPFMHSESLKIHEKASQLFNQEGLPYDYEIKHKNIIEKFGRYPHRNHILERESSPEEIEFLKGPDSKF